jgi:indolepyruvate ferredoxin oxidoreductase, beta subunit
MASRSGLLAEPTPTSDASSTTGPTDPTRGFSGSVMIVGVGGQGVIMASNIIADVALSNGLDVKNAEVHGMSQRGGMVTSQVRFGPEVYSTLMEPGTADFVIALEWAEALRSFAFLAADGMLIASSQRIIPPAALSNRVTGRYDYPLDGWTDPRALRVDAQSLAEGAGDVRAAATVLLGVLATRMPFPVRSWREALRRWVPAKALQANERSFELGRAWRPAAAAPARTKTVRPPELSTTSSVTVNAGWCKGAACSICVDVCPERVFVMGPESFSVPANAGRCTGCNLCMKLCPDFAIEVTTIDAGMPETGVSGAPTEVRNG